MIQNTDFSHFLSSWRVVSNLVTELETLSKLDPREARFFLLFFFSLFLERPRFNRRQFNQSLSSNLIVARSLSYKLYIPHYRMRKPSHSLTLSITLYKDLLWKLVGEHALHVCPELKGFLPDARLSVYISLSIHRRIISIFPFRRSSIASLD